MHADDLLLLSSSIISLQQMLDICSMYGELHNIVFNPNNTVCLVMGKYQRYKPNMYLNEQMLHRVNQFKYLVVLFNVGSRLTDDAAYLKRKFYAAMNSVLTRSQ
jgi:hypothetical protein